MIRWRVLRCLVNAHTTYEGHGWIQCHKAQDLTVSIMGLDKIITKTCLFKNMYIENFTTKKGEKIR